MLKTENGLIIRMCKVLMRGKMMGVNFEFNFEELDNNELRINGRRADFLSFRQWRSIIIKKEWISWIITTLRNLTYEDYNTWEKTVGINYEDCELAIIMCLFEREHSYIDIFPNTLFILEQKIADVGIHRALFSRVITIPYGRRKGQTAAPLE